VFYYAEAHNYVGTVTFFFSFYVINVLLLISLISGLIWEMFIYVDPHSGENQDLEEELNDSEIYIENESEDNSNDPFSSVSELEEEESLELDEIKEDKELEHCSQVISTKNNEENPCSNFINFEEEKAENPKIFVNQVKDARNAKLSVSDLPKKTTIASPNKITEKISIFETCNENGAQKTKHPFKRHPILPKKSTNHCLLIQKKFLQNIFDEKIEKEKGEERENKRAKEETKLEEEKKFNSEKKEVKKDEEDTETVKFSLKLSPLPKIGQSSTKQYFFNPEWFPTKEREIERRKEKETTKSALLSHFKSVTLTPKHPRRPAEITNFETECCKITQSQKPKTLSQSHSLSESPPPPKRTQTHHYHKTTTPPTTIKHSLTPTLKTSKHHKSQIKAQKPRRSKQFSPHTRSITPNPSNIKSSYHPVSIMNRINRDRESRSRRGSHSTLPVLRSNNGSTQNYDNSNSVLRTPLTPATPCTTNRIKPEGASVTPPTLCASQLKTDALFRCALLKGRKDSMKQVEKKAMAIKFPHMAQRMSKFIQRLELPQDNSSLNAFKTLGSFQNTRNSAQLILQKTLRYSLVFGIVNLHFRFLRDDHDIQVFLQGIKNLLKDFEKLCHEGTIVKLVFEEKWEEKKEWKRQLFIPLFKNNHPHMLEFISQQIDTINTEGRTNTLKKFRIKKTPNTPDKKIGLINACLEAGRIQGKDEFNEYVCNSW
jgi:hypothetical protein